MEMIPLLDLKQLNATFQAAIEDALLRVARSGRYILGAEVERFEDEWARYCGVKYCVGTGNALDAMTMTLMAMGIGPGYEVIVPSNTYIATWLAVSRVGATPVPVEPDIRSFTLDPKRVAAAITRRTAAIMPVHLYGRCAEMDEINSIASANGLEVVCDAAQAHGATYKGRRAGSLAGVEAFSFYPSKNLGAMGDGGCITTNDAAIADKVRRLRHYGGVGRVDHTMQGINSRLDEMQAAVLLAKLPHLDTLNAIRRIVAGRYFAELAGTSLVLPLPGESAWHQYVVRTNDRDLFVASLEAQGVEAHIHYPVPPHLEGAYAARMMSEGSLPIAERLAKTVVSLPIGYSFDFPRVIAAIRAAAQKGDAND